MLVGNRTTEGSVLEEGGAIRVPEAGILVIVNANASGERRAHRLLDELRRTARARDVPVAERVTGSAEELRRALEDAADRRVVLVGGDGTVEAAVNATGTAPELALLPAGRANNIAHALGIPLDPAGAVSVALTAPSRTIDLLRVESPAGALRCVEGVSIGFQARARSSYDGVNSGDLRAGVRALVGALRDQRPARAELVLDGHRAFAGDVAQVFVSNLPYFGFGFRVDPLADPADGRLEVIVASVRSRRELGRLLLAAHGGSHIHRRGVLVFQGRRATVRGELPLAGDGAVLGVGDVSVVVEPAALRLAAAEGP